MCWTESKARPRVRLVVHRQEDAGGDHDHQGDHRQRAEVPEVVEVLRRREGAVFLLHHREDGQTGVDPVDHRIAEVALVLAGHRWNSCRLRRQLRQPILILVSDLEGVGRQRQIGRRRPVAHAPGRVVLAAVARAEPAAPLAARVGRLVAERDAAEMRADADQHDPLVMARLHPVMRRAAARSAGSAARPRPPRSPARCDGGRRSACPATAR